MLGTPEKGAARRRDAPEVERPGITSEAERGAHLHHAPSLLDGGRAEERRVDRPGGAVEPEVQGAAARKRPQRMVEEVVAVRLQRQLSLLGDVEVLEDTQVCVD